MTNEGVMSKRIVSRQRSKRAVHPGAILAMEMEARGLSALALSLKLRVPPNRISEIVAGRRGITPETALRLGHFFGTGAEIWSRLQVAYDLAMAEREHGAAIRREVEAA